MIAQALEAPKFIRKTQLSPSEYRKNFQQMDNDILLVITSPEADQITPLMSKIYLKLTMAPGRYWEREGVLRFEAEWREGKHVKAWAVLCEVLGVASATASKALAWMHDVGVIGYFAGKNGVGLRIFLNRAANSIGSRAAQGSKKILAFAPASSVNSPASPNEPAFNDSFAVEEEVSDSDFNSRAPNGGAADKNRMDKNNSAPDSEPAINATVSVDEIIRRIRSEIEPAMESAAQRAAHREHQRTREWLESRGLPKAARVAQREAYNVLRQNGVVSPKGERVRADLQVGRNDYTPAEAQLLSAEEIKTYAEMCVAMLETHGQDVEVTLSDLSSEAGGPILPEDALKVRAEAEKMINSSGRKEQ
jgi:hypothetical protein